MTPIFLILLLVLAQQHGQAADTTHPNIIFILADDMGYGDLQAFNPDSRIRTPHLTQLAESGMRFTDAHSGGSTCKPSRYALLTGRFAARKERFNDKSPIISEGRLTIASLLHAQGYHTAMVGKWHLGFERGGQEFNYDRPLRGGPVHRGFDSFFGMHASLDIQPYFYIRNNRAVMAATETVAASTSVGGREEWNNIQGAFWRAGKISPDFRHEEVTQRFAGEACRVIKSHEADTPLFLYLALPSPHTPWLPAKKFVGKSEAGMYGDFVMTVDDVVGQVLRAVDDSKLSDNTIVMFSSDNGPVWYEKDVDRFGHRSVGPLRGAKGSAWEGGHRVPFLVRWPGRIKAGSTSQRTIAFSDVLATLAEITSATESVPVDSRSFAGAFTAEKDSEQRTSPVMHGRKVIRMGDWKLINTGGSRGFGADRKRDYGIALYNLREDLSEQENLARTMPQKVEDLRDLIKATLSR